MIWIKGDTSKPLTDDGKVSILIEEIEAAAGNIQPAYEYPIRRALLKGLKKIESLEVAAS